MSDPYFSFEGRARQIIDQQLDELEDPEELGSKLDGVA